MRAAVRRSVARRVMPLMVMLPFLVTSVGCDLLGGEEPSAPPPPAPRRERAATPPPAPEASEPQRFDIERQTFSSLSRDPFSKPWRPVMTTGSVAVQRECETEDEPLGFTLPGDLRLIGLITGTPVPRAMFQSEGRGDGKALIVTEGALVGPRCSQRITEIRDNEVVVTQLSDVEEERTQTIIPLTRTTVDAEVDE